ncbi:protein LNK3-like isoform X1 [Quillaja saponaria]|uniref:Protein LNK3-like isoform X1 n=1 Tax=Quillaja saponaria TaxID=32244 RepID=A0AAD7QJF7_QUISA|nr:protein LNK3-like isoform X1 [Quillaja saponaria]
MDWYYGSRIDDLVVPKDQELSDRLPLPDNWSNWGISTPEVFNSANKFFTMDTNEMEEDLELNDLSLSDEVGLETSVHDKDQSSGSRVCEGLPEQFLNQTYLSPYQPNYQLQYLEGFEQMDDIFLHSVLEDLHGDENANKSFFFYPESQGSMTTGDNLLTDIKGFFGRNVSTTQFIPSNSKKKDRPPIDAPPIKVLAPCENNSRADGMHHEKSSLEESILQELEMVMAQFTEKTRISFRDALYRLAGNSKEQQIVENQEGCFTTQKTMPWTDHNETMRSGKRKAMELETNTIDRAIANLMFNKMEFNIQDLPLAMPANSKQEVIETPGQQAYSSNQI